MPGIRRSPGETLKLWLHLSRLPFHSVGVSPFILGTVLAWDIYGTFSLPIFGFATLAVILIMLATYYGGEYHDLEEDSLAAQQGKNPFSGGSQVIVKRLMPRSYAKIGSYTAIGLAGGIGLLLQFYYHTGAWTIPLGLIGMISGFFYSAPPLRWVKRGFGELFIGLSYGWLPVATAFYLQTGTMAGIGNWISIPIACSIFNVILINEFPDYPADLKAGKRNLTVRVGKRAAARIYVTMAIISWLAFVWSVNRGVPSISLLFYLPIFLLGLKAVAMVINKEYLDAKRLEVICGLTIMTNLGTALAYMLAIWLGN
ncbi:MAG: prenyltransferase [Dehalococcoidia bacterium]|nr:prenyltransferase [Dehalococcoidia bacterium]